MKRFMAGVVAGGLWMLAGGAAAQTVYKCTANGRVGYSEQPCAGAVVTTLAPPAAPGEAAAAAASEQLARDKARLAALQKQQAAEAAHEERTRQLAARSARSAAMARQKCEQLRLQGQWAQEDLARAGHKATPAMQTRARRQAQALGVQCPG